MIGDDLDCLVLSDRELPAGGGYSDEGMNKTQCSVLSVQEMHNEQPSLPLFLYLLHIIHTDTAHFQYPIPLIN